MVCTRLGGMLFTGASSSWDLNRMRPPCEMAGGKGGKRVAQEQRGARVTKRMPVCGSMKPIRNEGEPSVKICGALGCASGSTLVHKNTAGGGR